MQSFLHRAKLFCRVLAAAIFVLNLSTLTLAQRYQSYPNSSLMYQPRSVNSSSQQRTYPPQIYPGQIINGERVISPSVRPSTSQPSQYPKEYVNPPQPSQSGADLKTPSSKDKRTDKVPKTIFPIPEGPTLKLEPVEKAGPAATADPATKETPPNAESSIATEEESDLSKLENPVQNQPTDADDEMFQDATEPLGLELTEDTPLELDAPSLEAPSSQPQLSVTPSTDDLSLDLFEDEEASAREATDQPPLLGEASGDQASPRLPTEEEIMAEIKEIRDQLHDSNSERLSDVESMPSFDSMEIAPAQYDAASETDADVTPEEMFDDQLRSVMSEQEMVESSVLDASPRPSRTQPMYAARTEELRDCARELEQLAGRLERVEAYEHADQIRRQAVDLWTTARQR